MNLPSWLPRLGLKACWDADLNAVAVLAQNVQAMAMRVFSDTVIHHHSRNRTQCLVVFVVRQQAFELFHAHHVFIDMFTGQLAFALYH